MKVWEFYLPSPEHTELFAQCLGRCLQPKMLLTLSGDIGAGKTTVVRALLRSLGVDGAIKSPTFSLVESYDIGTQHFHHFDLYRIIEETELEFLGFRDYFQSDAICCIEWPERMNLAPDHVDIALILTRVSEGRNIRMMVQDKYESVIEHQFNSFNDVLDLLHNP